jgi:cytochrome c553
MFNRIVGSLLTIAVVALSAACGGSYSGTPSTGSSTGTSTGQSFSTPQAYFAARVEPRLTYCRTCHVPGGVADVVSTNLATQGSLMMLSSNSSDDQANLQASWTALGGNNPVSRILKMPSGTDTVVHAGGTPWPVGSDAYNDVAQMLSCFQNPSQCLAQIASVTTGAPTTSYPLLGSQHGSSAFERFCEGADGKTPQADSAALPVDPRTMVVNGANAGKAVYFNAFYQNCLVNEPASMQLPQTCGDYRTARTAGFTLLNSGVETKYAQTNTPGASMTADQYNSSWTKWGLTSRPANFDAVYSLATGFAQAPFSNPYPQPGEDPNTTNGGTGQLPLGFVQLKDASGNWTGTIASGGCYTCHAGTVGSPTDAAGLGGMWGLTGAETDNAGLQRGQSDAVTGFEILEFSLSDWDSLDPASPKQYMPTHLPSRQDTPAWWNSGHRARKFFDGGTPVDSFRITTAAIMGFAGTGVAKRAYSDANAVPLAMALESIKSPSYPFPINTASAEQGAVLFHTLNLFADPANANVPKPAGGNGSCAGCHGAYSPNFVNDPTYLSSPALEGVGAHIVTLNVIGTDRNRSDQLSGIFADVWNVSWWSYLEGLPGFVEPGDTTPAQSAVSDNLNNDRPLGVCNWTPGVVGYQAPPLYGVWASAPYFHNGSVPTVEQVLKSADRPAVWQRQTVTLSGVTGFDTSLSAIDTTRLGWNHTALTCDPASASKFTNCNPVRDQATIFETFTGTAPAAQASTTAQRLIYNTKISGNSNSGHTFTDVLTDAQRLAIIEYLKTL